MKFRKHYLQDYLKLEGAKIKEFFGNPDNLVSEDGASKALSDFLDEILMVKGYSAAYEESGDAWSIEYTTTPYGSFDEFANDMGNLCLGTEGSFCICFTVYAWRNVAGFRGSLRISPDQRSSATRMPWQGCGYGIIRL